MAGSALQIPTSAPAKEPRTRADSLRVLLVEAQQLRNYESAWWQLSGNTLVPNVFYDPWMLLPAVERYSQPERLRFVLVFGPADSDNIEPLWGFFPLELQDKCLHLPIRTLAFWQHRNCHLTVPLIFADKVWEVLDGFWRWFERNPLGCHILDTNFLPAEGRFHAVWTDFAIGRSSIMLRDFPRAFLAASGTASSYISAAFSKKHYDEYLRQERRLAELGKLEYRQVEDPAAVDAWLDEFLELEAAGWKGGEGGAAFSKREEDSTYFREMTHRGFGLDRVMLLSLTLNGKAIAMKHNLQSGDGSFALRIAYDESYAKYSPGVLLELDNIRRVFAHPQVKWQDSCAKPRHVMANRIWRERRMLRRTLFSDGSRPGEFWMAFLPMLRWVRQQLKRQPDQDYLQISTRL
jgi:hypothetical protein